MIRSPTTKRPADYWALAKARGFRWLGPEVPDVMTKTTWECSQGHRWETAYHTIQQGCGCPVCSKHARKSPDDFRALAKARGFRWLGPEVPNVMTKTTWKCSQGHCWEATYHRVQRGHGCPVCAGNVRRTPADYRALASARGFRWLGPEVPNVSTKTIWQCSQGHRWGATFRSLREGHGCPVCAHRVQKTPADYQALAKARGFRWLGPEAPDVMTKTSWKCARGHLWQAPYNTIRQGHGCPVCAEVVRKTPADYRALAIARGFRWLGPAVSNTRTKTSWKCSLEHQWEAHYNSLQQGHGCPVCAGSARKTPADYQDLAKERGFRWLGPDVPNTRTKTWWGCPRGHEWEAGYRTLQSGHGCPICARRSR